MTKARGFLVLAVGSLALISLAGCTQPASPQPVGSAKTSVAPSASASAPVSAAPAPTFVPAGTAEQNRAFFDHINTALFASNGSATGQQIITNLVAQGFTKADMQVTPDKSSINGAVDSILFSVKIGATCLLGQFGGGQYTGSTGAALASGVCLIGKTRPINW